MSERMSNFYDWFTLFLEEKKIDLSEFCREGIQVGDVCQAICDTNEEEQEAIKKTLITLDLKNGDFMHYFTHLSQALIKEDVDKRRHEMAFSMIEKLRRKKKNAN